MIIMNLVFVLCTVIVSSRGTTDFTGRMSNSWAVEILGGNEIADNVARRHGLINLGQVGSLHNKYTFVLLDKELLSSSPSQSFSSMKYDSSGLMNDPEIKRCTHQPLRTVVKKYLSPVASEDPIWQYQWNMNNTGQTTDPNLFLDLNVIGAWIQGYTGSGVIVGVVDDGVEYYHDDLRQNYNSANSYDYFDNDGDPRPPSSVDDHGTAVAGVIAMIRSNGVCGIGVAYDSQIAGIRLIGGETVDSQEAGSLSHNRNNIPIYSNSWGPFDDAITVMGPGPLTLDAFADGSSMGRNNLGNIFLWAAGNGGDVYDSCAADGYVQSIYTIPVGAYSQNGAPASYDEPCSAKMTVAYVDNTFSLNPNLQVPSLSTGDRCTLEFDGTSAATPFVSAIIALALEANSDLTWRDIQYLIVYTSNSDPLVANSPYSFENGAGLMVSHYFGFGAIDGEAFVTRAQRWINVPDQISTTIEPSVDSGMASYNNPFMSTISYTGNIQYVEHIVVTMTLNVTGFTDSIDYDRAAEILGNAVSYDFSSYIKRGDLQVNLTSPSGTTSVLLFERPIDIVNSEGYYEWPFLTVLHWGENPIGQWTVTVDWVTNNGGRSNINIVSAKFYGVSQTPQAVANIPNTCDPVCARSKGCSGPEPSDCDACNSNTVRNATTLECIDPVDCVEPFQIDDGYCYIPSSATSFTGSILLVFLCLMFVHV